MSTLGELDKVFRHIDEHFEEHVEETRRLLKQPSISLGDKKTCLPNIEKSGKMLIGYINELEGEARLVPLKEGFPVVYGKIKSNKPNAKTLIVYDLYDVMPVEGEEWKVPPFAAEIVDAEEIGVPKVMGKLIVCRGASNQKGPLMAWISALKSIKEVAGDIPVNLIFVLESEEELGSIHLGSFVDKYSNELKYADGIILPMMIQSEPEHVPIYLGAKGILAIELEVKGGEWGGPAERALYTADGHFVDAPSWHLVHALATLSNQEDEVLIKSFYENVRAMTEQERELFQRVIETFDEEAVRKSLGVKKFKSGSREKQIQEYFLGPTLNISGYQCGYTGAYIKTNFPMDAIAKMDIRLVPNQTPEEILHKLRSHLDKHGFSEVKIHKQASYNWYRTPPSADIVKVLVEATKRMGVDPVVYPSGYWSDPCSIVAKPGNLYDRIISFGLGGSGNYHQANEWVSIEGLRLTEKQFCTFLYEYSKLP